MKEAKKNQVNQWTTQGEPQIFIDREADTRRLRNAIGNRESLLICGPAGVGKTAFVFKVFSDLAKEKSGCCFYVSGMKGLQDFLRKLIRRLHESGDPVLCRQLREEGFAPAAFKAWINSRRTSRLKGTLYRAVEKRNYWVFLDHFPPLTYAVAKVVKELVRMRNTPVYLLARGFTERDVGHVTDLYWSERQRLVLGPVPEASAQELLEDCIQRFSLSNLDLEDFSEEILRLSGHVPGAIVRMCALAADPRYQYQSRVKTRLVHIDYLMGEQDIPFSPPKAERGFQP